MAPFGGARGGQPFVRVQLARASSGEVAGNGDRLLRGTGGV